MINMTAAIPDMWQERFKFSLQRANGAAIEFAGMTEDISGLDFGDKDVEGVALANGGRRMKWTPQADESVTVKVWPTDAKLTGNGVVQWFHPLGTDDGTDPINVPNSHLRPRHQAIWLWATDIGDIGNAGSATTSGQPAYRIRARNVYVTSYKPDNTDKNLGADVTLKWGPFDRTGSANKNEESTASTGGAVLPAVPAFTE